VSALVGLKANAVAVEGNDMALADDPQALAGFIRHLGGQPIEHRTFRFEIPLGEVQRVIPEINKLQLRCTKVSERQDNDANGKACSVATIEISRQPVKSEYQQERDLVHVCVR
jgi:hypothetical protein